MLRYKNYVDFDSSRGDSPGTFPGLSHKHHPKHHRRSVAAHPQNSPEVFSLPPPGRFAHAVKQHNHNRTPPPPPSPTQKTPEQHVTDLVALVSSSKAFFSSLSISTTFSSKAAEKGTIRAPGSPFSTASLIFTSLRAKVNRGQLRSSEVIRGQRGYRRSQGHW